MDENLKTVNIYTDGACSGNPGPGGWGAILEYGGHKKEMRGYVAGTTNNRMEMMAAIAALEALKKPCDVELHSDSKYLTDAFNAGWISGWVRRGWKKSDGKPVLNPDLWKRLLDAAAPHRITWIWVKGHDGNELNERCDRLATAAADSMKDTE